MQGSGAKAPLIKLLIDPVKPASAWCFDPCESGRRCSEHCVYAPRH